MNLLRSILFEISILLTYIIMNREIMEKLEDYWNHLE